MAQTAMRAVVTVAHGGLDMLEVRRDYPLPQPGPGEVRLRVAATALNYHDIFTRRGMPGIRVPLPLVVGSDIAGTIDALGSDVGHWREGDRVLVDPVCTTGPRRGLIGEAFDGGRSEFVVVAVSQLIAVPDGVDLKQAAALPLAYATAYRMMVTRGHVQPGETVLVLGASGGVGVACVQLAKILGAKVIACASSQAKLDRLAELGADQLVDYSQRDFADSVRELVGKPGMWGSGGVDVAVNFTGGDTFLSTQKCVKRGGRILVCGATAGYDLAVDARFLWTFEHDIVGSNGWGPGDLATLLDLIAGGRLAPAIDRFLPLEQAAEAERMLEEREVVGKILLVP